MSQNAPKLRGRAALDAELARFGPGTVSVRLCTALFDALPNGPRVGEWTSLEAAIAAHDAAELTGRIAELTEAPEVDRALFAAKSIDTGDTGITVLTGVRTALSLVLGDKGPGAGAAAQQRADAALKALGLAYLATQLIPRDPARRGTILANLPAGRALVLTYAAVEVALPFGAEAASGHFVRDLVDGQSRRIAGKLLGVIGRQGLTDAQETLDALVGQLDRAVVAVAPHTDGVADTIRGVLPKLWGGHASTLSDVVAAGADALPLYRLLAARLAVETRIALAQWEADPAREPVEPPEPDPVPEPPIEVAAASMAVPAAAPPPVPMALAGAALATERLHPSDPMAEPAAAAPSPESDVEAEPSPEVAQAGEHDLNGVYQRSMPWGELWLVFTRDGVFTNHPPEHPEADWVEHADQGHQVGTYQHIGDQLEIRWSSGKSTTSTFSREPTALILDGERCGRCDWNLDGHHFDGTWQARGGERWVKLDAEHRYEGSFGAGRYELGVGALAWHGDDGSHDALTLYSTLSPDSARPDTLWIGGQPYDRAPDSAP